MSTRRAPTAAALVLALLASLATGVPALGQPADPGEASPALDEEVLVVESSILLQRMVATEVADLDVVVGSALGEAVAVYPVREVELPTTVYFDLCKTSFSRLVHAVTMVDQVAERLVERGPVSVLASIGGENQVLLEPSSDVVVVKAAFASVLWKERGGCPDLSLPGALQRLRQTVNGEPKSSAAASLLIVFGFDHSETGGSEISRHLGAFEEAGRELAVGGRTLVVLEPAESDEPLQEKDVRPLLGDPEGPPRTIDLTRIAERFLRREHTVPADPRLLDLAVDPGTALLRELIADSRGRLFGFPRQLEAFVGDLERYHVLYYRVRLREGGEGPGIVPIEVRRRGSGDIVRSARFVRVH